MSNNATAASYTSANVAFVRLILKNALRNRRRTLLTTISVAVSLFLLVSLRTLITELKGDTLMTEQSGRRMITRSAVSLQVPLPLAYKEKLARIPGVERVSEYQWIPSWYREPNIPLVIIACDPKFIGTDPQYPTIPAEVAAFQADRTAVLVPKKLMKKYGWRLGQRVTFHSTVFPFDVEGTVRGSFAGPSQNALFCWYDYFNEMLRRTIPDRADRTMAFVETTRTAADAPAVSAAIDAMFTNSIVPTRTESEKNFVLGFTAMLGNVTLFISAIAAAVVFAIVLVTTNTMSMAVRERKHEIAVLKTLGFRPAHVVLLIAGESLAISTAGAIIGIGGARLFFRVFDIYDLTNTVVQHFDVTTETMALAALLALAMAFVSSLVPAISAARTSIAKTLRET
jgi:putative ABC transport system permease protein